MKPDVNHFAPTPFSLPTDDFIVRQQADAAQRLSDLALKAVSQGVIITGPDTKIISTNTAFLAITGYTEAEVLGRSCKFLQGPGSDPQMLAAIRQAVENQREFTGEILNYRKDGTSYWNDLTISPVHDTQGALTHYIGINRDITARKQTEAKLRESEQRYAATMAAVNDGLWDWNLLSGEAYCSPLYYTMLGYADRAYPSNYASWRTLVHPEDLDQAERVVQNSLKTGQGFAIDMRMKTAGGAWCWVSSRGKAIEWDADGKALRMVGTLSDITARKELEAALHDEQERLKTIFNTVGAPVFVKDNDHRIIHANQAFYEMFALNEHAVIGQTLADNVPENERQHFLAVDRQVLDTGQPDLREESLTVHDHTLTIITRKTRFIDDSGKRFLVGSIQDITNRKQSEAALARTAKLLEVTGALAKIGGWEVNLENMKLSWTLETFRIAELEPPIEPPLEQGINLFAPEARPTLAAAVQAAIDTGKPYDLELPLITAKGNPRWVQTQGYAEMQNGKTIRIYGTFQDITARKEVEAALRASDQRFRDLVNSTDGIVWEADAITFNFTSVSHNAERLIGYPLTDWLQTGFWASHIHPEDRDRAVEYCASCTGRLEDHDFEYRFLSADGRSMWLRDIVRVVSENNQPRWLRGLIVDITAQKEISAALQFSLQEKALVEDQLRQSQKLESLGTLAGGIAHDFNNILAGISGFNSLARQAAGNNAETIDYLGEIDRAAQRAATLVQQILAFSRADNHTLVLTQIRPVVAEAVQLLRATLPSSIVFNVSLATDLPPILGNATQLHQVVMNLGTNAGYAMREKGGSLSIRLEAVQVENPAAAGLPEIPLGPGVQLTVSDTGCGMDAHTMRRVFDPFFTTKGPGEGSGLGLSVLHGIVRTHHGAIRLTSELGQGTTFTVLLPAIVTETVVADLAPEAIPLGQSQRILFVDDEEILTRLGALLLRQLGYAAERVSSARKALTHFERDPQAFDLVLTDQTMPGMSGLELATRLHHMRPDLPVIIASGYNIKLTPQQIQTAGVKEVLAKPYTKESLAAALHRQLKSTARK